MSDAKEPTTTDVGDEYYVIPEWQIFDTKLRRFRVEVYTCDLDASPLSSVSSETDATTGEGATNG